MSIVLNDVSRFRLDNLDNYKPQLDMKSLDIIFMKYTHIICEFFDLIEKSKFKPNKGFHLYVVMKGIETIQHIFNFLLYTHVISILSIFTLIKHITIILNLWTKYQRMTIIFFVLA